MRIYVHTLLARIVVPSHTSSDRGEEAHPRELDELCHICWAHKFDSKQLHAIGLLDRMCEAFKA